MYKQSSSGRNVRTKGFKVKHVVQACVLAAICVWLLYQVKHSHDKKKALEEGIIKISTVVDANHGFFRFGRKDIPHVDTGDSKEKMETTGMEDGNEYTDEVEAETNHDEHLEEEQLDHEDEDETGGNGEDGIDENDQDEERDNSEETKEEGDYEEGEIKRNQSEAHNGGGWSNVGRNYEASTQVARERNYKGDDVSSAVFRSFESTASEGGSQELMFNVEKKDSEIQNGTTKTDDGKDREFEFHQSSNGTMKATSKAEMEHGVGSLQMNSTTSESGNLIASNNSEVVIENIAGHSSIGHDQNMTTTGIQILRESTDKKPNTTGTAIDAPFNHFTTVPYANHSTKFPEIEEKEEIAED